MSALAYWDEQFRTDWQRRGHENRMLALDFYWTITGHEDHGGIGHPRFINALKAKRIIELGCGTGEFTGVIEWAFRPEHLVGTDLSSEAINRALARSQFLRFQVLDFMEAVPDGHYELAVASQVLEHFTEPHAVIDRILSFADRLLALAPYRQPVTDGFDFEGGPGHVSSFNKKSFAGYRVIDTLVFQTGAWSFSSAGEKPQQLAVLLEAR